MRYVPPNHPRHPARNRGSVLIIAMVILFALAALVLTLNRGARTDMALSANISATHQADAIERAAEQYVMALLTDYRDTLTDLTDTDFAQVPVGDGYFWITRPNYGDTTVSTYGLMDESSKLNLNTATYEVLRTLPGMTDEIAGAIDDWRDIDDEPSENGAESNSYTGLSVSYRAKNADFEAVEEMLLLKGMTRDLMYGIAGSTQSGSTQNESTQVGSTDNGFNSEYYQSSGLADFFTVWSTRAAPPAGATTRINVNDQSQRPQLRTMLREALGASRGDQVANSIGPGAVIDIFAFAQRVTLTTDEFPLIEDSLTFQQGTAPQRGLININTAPREVLLALAAAMPSPMSESDIDALIARRSG
ncbi:MAG: general secretion pathway protein GspK, partial [Anaerolineae bacterium]|nr:general secretion pathway protein GspK [Phycisphaerae bacterium]